MKSKICAIVFALLCLSVFRTQADDLNVVRLRGLAFRMVFRASGDTRVFLHEQADKLILPAYHSAFDQAAWFSCPTGYCVTPNDLGCPYGYELVSSTPTTATEFGQDVYECAYPPGVTTGPRPDGQCLSMAGWINFEGGDFMRPFMAGLAVRTDCSVR